MTGKCLPTHPLSGAQSLLICGVHLIAFTDSAMKDLSSHIHLEPQWFLDVNQMVETD